MSGGTNRDEINAQCCIVINDTFARRPNTLCIVACLAIDRFHLHRDRGQLAIVRIDAECAVHVSVRARGMRTRFAC